MIDEGGELRVEVDRHTGGLFPTETWLSLLEAAGLEAEYIQTNAYEGGFAATCSWEGSRRKPDTGNWTELPQRVQRNLRWN